MSPLLLLAEKVEGLEGPDREVDAAIIRSFGHAVEHPTGDEWFYQPPNRMGREQVPRYTGSLDAALSLVPEGWRLDHLGEKRITGGAIAIVGSKRDIDADGYGSHAGTLPLAIVAACLRVRDHIRARAAMEAGE